MKHHLSRAGFTLVELSIVLVILGLLVGGVLTGQSLIRAAEIRSVTTQANGYITAAYTFRDKYFALPGDMANATAYWGQSTACGGASATGTCNGNGDGQLTDVAIPSGTNEVFQVWRHLALAGLIEGNYSGLAGGSSNNHSLIGNNVPAAKISGVGWFAGVVGFSTGYFSGSSEIYAGTYGNALAIGIVPAGSYASGPFLKPDDAYNLDVKMDDGKPGTGRIIARFWNNACANASANTDYAGTYRLAETTMRCSLFFTNVF